MKRTWEINVNGTIHKIEYKAGWGVKLLVDGQKHKLRSQNVWINMIDYPISIDDEEIRLVVIGKETDLAVNGVYVSNGEKYTPLEKMPSNVNVFIAISVIGGLIAGGWLCAMIGILFGQVYAKKGLAGDKKGLIWAFVGCTAVQFAYFVVAVALNILTNMV